MNKLTIEIPDADIMQAIFKILTQGVFICSDSPKYRHYYEIIAKYYNGIKQFCNALCYELEERSGYYYLANSGVEKEKNQNIENKISKLLPYIDIFAFFGGLEQKPEIGNYVRPSRIIEECYRNPNLESLLKSINEFSALDLEGRVKDVCDKLVEHGFFEKIDRQEKTEYLVLSSFEYLQTLISLIQPYESAE